MVLHPSYINMLGYCESVIALIMGNHQYPSSLVSKQQDLD